MDAEQTQEVLDTASETQEQQASGMEQVSVSKLDLPGESTEPEKSPVKVQETLQLAVNGHEAEQSTVNEKGTEELPEMGIDSEETHEMEMEAEKSPMKMSEPEMSRENIPEPEMSPEKVAEPVSVLCVEPENILNVEPEQQPMPEKTPEPLPLDEPLAENNTEPAPEKMGEPVPEAVQLFEQAAPEPVTQPEFEEVKQIEQVEKVPEEPEIMMEVEAEPETVKEVEAEPETVKEVESETIKEAESEKAVEADTVKETVPEMQAVAENMKEVESEKPAEAETVKEVASEAQAEAEAVKEEESEKPAEAETVKEVASETQADSVKEVESEKPAEAETVKEVASEAQAEGEVEQQEEEQVPAPGSLSFAFLEQEQTKVTLRTSRTLIILRGLPGSGKSLLARAIADNYEDLCTVCCADDYGVKPESPETSVDGYKALDEAIVACCSGGTAASVVVVDDTNHTQDRLARLGEVAEQHRLVAVYLEPRTEWNRDLSQLAKKTGRGLEEAQIQAMKVPLEETALPFFFGWFLLPSVQDKVRCTSMDFLKTLDTLEAFKKHLTDFTGEAEKEVDLEQYFQPKGALHCTTKFCDYGKAEGATEYAEKPAVKELYGSAFELLLSALFVTPRTVGARVALSERELALWPDDAEKEAKSVVPSADTLPLGSRAHITLGCAEGVEPVQTGLDLLEILALQQEGQQGELVEEMELGSLAYYGKGRWLLSLREPVTAQACFSSIYGPKKADQGKKEAEKKKKPKCTIL